jgi:hypothetical protein
MGNNAFVVSYVMLWCFVAILAYAVILLYRHHGRILFANDARYAAGPAIGAAIPRDERTPAAIDAQMESGIPTLFLFVSSNCAGCLTARAAVNNLVDRTTRPAVMAIISGKDAEIDEFAGSLSQKVALVRDPERKLTRAWHIPGVPYALATDGAGYIQAKGAVSSMADLELFVGKALNEHAPIRQPRKSTLATA